MTCWRLRDIWGTTNKTVSALPALTSGAHSASLSIPNYEAAQRTRGATRASMLERCSRSNQGPGIVQRPQCGSLGRTPLGRNHQGILDAIRRYSIPRPTVTIRREGASQLRSYIRYGRRIQIPSTVQVKHELRAFIAEENVRELCAEADGLPPSASWKDIENRRQALSPSASTH